MKNEDKVKALQEYRELQELKSKADKRIKELKEQIQSEIQAGKYGNYFLNFEIREVRSYVVPARTDHIVKVSKL